MKISFHFLLATGFALGPSLLANSQSLFPSDRATPLTNQSLFTPKKPLGSIWQPLPTPLIGYDRGRLHLPVLSQPDDNSIRTLRPDNMPCLVPNLAGVKRMPVDRRGNADPINHMSVHRGRMTILGK